MKTIAEHILVLCLALLVPAGAFAQEGKNIGGIPEDVYYLMPAFADGMVYFTGQRPAEGTLNICAVDNTLRFMDNGKELAAASDETVVRVRIDTVNFMHANGVYYRMYPVSAGIGAALKREVKLKQGAKTGAYGMTSQTSSIQEKSTLYADGIAYNLSGTSQYEVSETLFLYKGDEILPLNKRNLRRLFPARKQDIDAFFSLGNPLPTTSAELIPILRLWAE